MNEIDLDNLANMVGTTAAPGGEFVQTRTTSRQSAGPKDQGEQRAPRDAYVMIVDDESTTIDLIQSYLEDEGFGNFVTTTDSCSAIDMLRQHRPDVLLLDINMPKYDGLQILQEMRGDKILRKIPSIVVTASTDGATKLKALRLGASDFLAKPVDPSELLLRLENVLNVKTLQDHLADYSERLEQQVEIRTQELLRSRQEAILCLARAAEYRDDDTGQHVTRVGRYSAIVADQLKFPKPAVDLIEQAAQLHDVGKIGIPDAILHKPCGLEDDEYTLMQTHCGIGRRIIASDAEAMREHTSLGMRIMRSTTSPVLKMAAVIAQTHHEKWDGSGYPRGLKGKEIPIEGRIVAVADVFDALSSKRPYKDPFPLEKCFRIIEDGRGKHFDPRVLDAFMARKDEVVRVRDECIDAENGEAESLDLIEQTV